MVEWGRWECFISLQARPVLQNGLEVQAGRGVSVVMIVAKPTFRALGNKSFSTGLWISLLIICEMVAVNFLDTMFYIKL